MRDNSFLSEIDWNLVKKDYLRIKYRRRLLGRFVPHVEILNSSRVELSEGEVPIYVPNHVSHLDHFVPPYAIIESGLPFPRSVASVHFKDSLFWRLLKFEKKGVIWNDRENHSLGYIRDYRSRVLRILNNNGAIFFHPEGKRNRHPERGLGDFKDAAFKMFFSIEDEIREKGSQRKLVFICMGLRYDDFPERNYYNKIGNYTDSFRYKYWDSYCMAKWLLKTHKGAAMVNFGKPIRLCDIGGRNSRDKGKNATEAVREGIDYLLREMK